jgi:hypothetical protein
MKTFNELLSLYKRSWLHFSTMKRTSSTHSCFPRLGDGAAKSTDQAASTYCWRTSIRDPQAQYFGGLCRSFQSFTYKSFHGRRRKTMPALAPKSALPYRPLASDVATEEPPRIARASLTKAPPRKNTLRRAIPRARPGFMPIGLGMLLMLVIVIAGSWLFGWIQTASDDLHYGRPRTFQLDAFVGHETGNTPSHFIVLNLHGQIEIIELPGGDATHARMYVGPRIYGPGADLVPVVLRFVDGTHSHHPDMLILFQNTQVVYRNVGGVFRPASP